MPPKSVSSEAQGGPASSKADEDFKLCWAIICQMSKMGKLGGINWDEVKGQLNLNSVKTAQNRYYNLRERMKEAELGLPDIDPTAKPTKTPTKRKEKAAVSENEGENGEKVPITPKKRKTKGEGDSEVTPKKTPRKTAKQIKAEKEAAAVTASGSGSSEEEAKEAIENEVNDTNDTHTLVDAEMEAF